jgi:RNA polymerase sigma factor (sigma-70 family)
VENIQLNFKLINQKLINPENSIIQLIEQCLQHNRVAQRQLYDKYKSAMFSVAYRILADYDEANDALQEAFIAAFTELASFRKDSSFGAWLKTIVIRKALYKNKWRRKHESYETVLEQETPNWHDALTGEILDKAIRGLPDGYRAVFSLIEIEGFSHKEAAELLQISEGTSKSQLFRAKKLLQEELKELK